MLQVSESQVEVLLQPMPGDGVCTDEAYACQPCIYPTATGRLDFPSHSQVLLLHDQLLLAIAVKLFPTAVRRIAVATKGWKGSIRCSEEKLAKLQSRLRELEWIT